MSSGGSKKPITAPPTAENLEADELKGYFLDLTKDYPEPHYMWQYKGVPFAPLGDIQAITGQKKNGKTFLLSQLLAAALQPDAPRVREYLPGLTLNPDTRQFLGRLPKALYVDTEQSQLSSAKFMRRVHYYCGWDMKEPNPRFRDLWLRAMDGNGKRWDIIKKAVKAARPDILVIDGLRDIINDFNDEEESMAIINELMKMSTDDGICILCVLHENPRPGQQDREGKMRGHLGTELGNKVSDTLRVYKTKKNGEVTFTVSEPDARNKDVPDWTFRVTGSRLGIACITGSDEGEEEQPAKSDTDSLDDIRDWIEAAQYADGIRFPMMRKDIKVKIFGQIGGVKDNNRQQCDLDAAIADGLLKECAEKRRGYPMLVPGDTVPF